MQDWDVERKLWTVIVLPSCHSTYCAYPVIRRYSIRQHVLSADRESHSGLHAPIYITLTSHKNKPKKADHPRPIKNNLVGPCKDVKSSVSVSVEEWIAWRHGKGFVKGDIRHSSAHVPHSRKPAQTRYPRRIARQD